MKTTKAVVKVMKRKVKGKIDKASKIEKALVKDSEDVPVIDLKQKRLKSNENANKSKKTAGKTKRKLSKASKPKLTAMIDTDIVREVAFYVGSLKTAIRHIFLKCDSSNECSISIANIPPFMTEENVESLLNAVASSIKITSLLLKQSTAMDGDLSKGYRSGTVTFLHVNDCRTFFEKCESIEPISLESIDVKLPKLGLQQIVDTYNAKFSTVEKLLLSANQVVAAYEERRETETAKRKFNEPDEEGWITVTKHDKNSFRGKINRSDSNNNNDSNSVLHSADERSKSKKRARKN